jgi:aromatic ring-opening dioxygenase catalytic subunit (LigB family)
MDAGRGSPLSEVDKKSKFAHLFKEIGKNPQYYHLPPNPSAIVCVSAHWEEPQHTILAHPNPGLLYDYYGFPQETYQIKYPVVGDTKLSQRIADMIQTPVKLIGLDGNKPSPRGFDHGVFLPLLLLYPQFTGPVIQISLEHSLDVKKHYQLGKALAPLRDENILIVTSGQATHPMMTMQSGRGLGKDTISIMDEFMKRLQKLITVDAQQIVDDDTFLAHIQQTFFSEEASKYLRTAHNPRYEHFTPIFVALGATSRRDEINKELFPEENMKVMDGLMSLQSYIFGLPKLPSTTGRDQDAL